MPGTGMSRIADRHETAKVPWGVFALAYGGLIVYGSLYPFSEWTLRTSTPFEFLVPKWPRGVSRVDVITNVLAYVPLGLLLVLPARQRSLVLPVALATLAGTALSIAVEFLQQFLPGRVTSIVDVVTNALGTFAGAVLASFVRTDSAGGRLLTHLRHGWFAPGRLTDLGLVAVVLWALSQLTPLVPSLDVGNLRQGVAPIWRILQHPSEFSPVQWATYLFYIAGLALLASTLRKPGQSIVVRFFAFVACVLLLKIPVITRQLSLEALAGAVGAAAVAVPFAAFGTSARERAWVGALFIVGGFVVAALAADAAGATHAFNWMPFRGQLENTLIGFASILESLWPAAALAYLARFASPPGWGWTIAWIGGLLLAMVAFALEWYQQFVPGRYGDVTIAVLMTVTWFLFWSIPVGESKAVAVQSGPTPGAKRGTEVRPAMLFGALALTVAIAAGALTTVAARHPVEVRVDESKLPQLPAPQELPPASLPGFRFAHPRLPAPTAAELAMLRTGRREFLRDHSLSGEWWKGRSRRGDPAGARRTGQRGPRPHASTGSWRARSRGVATSRSSPWRSPTTGCTRSGATRSACNCAPSWRKAATI